MQPVEGGRSCPPSHGPRLHHFPSKKSPDFHLSEAGICYGSYPVKLRCLPFSRARICALSLALPASLGAARAASLYWDGASTTADADGGSGTWSTAASPANWDSSATAGSDVPWTDGSDAVFGGTGGAVTISAPVSASSLSFTAAGYSLSGAKLTLTGTPVIDVAGNDVTLALPLAGSVPIRKTGAGTLALDGTNTFNGQFTIAEGTAKAGSSLAFGPSASVIVSPGATLEVNGKAFGTRVVTASGSGVGGAGAIINNGPGSGTDVLQNVTLSGPTTVGGTKRWDIRGTLSTLLMGGHTLTKVGPNDVHLVGVSVGSPGNIDVKEGSFWIELDCNLGGSAANRITLREGTKLGHWSSSLWDKNWTAAFEANTTWQAVTSSSRWSGPATLAGATGFDVGAAASMTTQGIISGPGSITKTGPGTWTLATPNTYTGGTTVNAGNLVLSTPTGAASSGDGTVRGVVTVNSGGTLTVPIANVLGTTAGARVDTLNISGGLVDITSSAGAGVPVLNFSSGTLRTNGGISDPEVASCYTMANDAVINSLAASAPGILSGRLHLGTGNTGNVSAFDIGSGAATQDLRIDAAITEANPGSGVVKRGTGLLVLNGPSFFTGNTSVEAGTLLLAPSGDLSGSPVVVNSGGRFGTIAVGKSLASLTANSGSSLVLPVQADDTTTVTGRLEFAAGNIGISPVIGADTLAGTYDLLAADSITGTGTPVLDLAAAFGPTRATGTLAVNGNKLQLTLTGTGAGLVWNNASAGGVASGTWDTTLANFSNDGVNDSFQAFDSVTFNDSVAPGSAKTVELGAMLAPARLMVDNSNGDYSFSATGGLAGAGSLMKTGSSKLTIAGPNGYAMSGRITAGGGVLDFAGQSVSAAELTLGGGGTFNNAMATLGSMDLQAGSSNALLLGGGAWSKTTPGTVILTANNRLTGPGTIEAGHLVLGSTAVPNSAGSLGTGPVTIAGGAAITISRGDSSPMVANSFSGSGSLNFTGSNDGANGYSAFSLTGDSSAFSGPVAVSNALISVLTGKEVGSGPISLTGRAALHAEGVTVPNAINVSANGGWGGSNDSNLILVNAQLTGPITLAGSTTTWVSAFWPAIGEDSASIISGPIHESGGSASVVLSGVTGVSNTLTLSGASTYTGSTSIGGVDVTLTGSLGATAVTVNGQGSLGGSGAIGNGGSLKFANGGDLKISQAGGALTVNGNVNLGSNTTVAVELTPNPVTSGPIPILHYTGTLTGGAAQLAIDAPGAYRKAVFAFSPGLITLDIGTKSLIWKGTSGQTWDTGVSKRWGTTSSGSTQTDFFYRGDSVTFDDSGGGGSVSSTGSTVQPSAVLVNNNTKDYSIGTRFSGPCSLTKNGSGSLSISGSNEFTGGTTVNGGRLEASSLSPLGSGPVNVAAGATLAGEATIPGPVTLAGTLDPGLSSETLPGTLSTGPLILTGSYKCQVDTNTSDRLAVTGDLNITGSALVLNKTYNFSNSEDSYSIATYTGTLTGSFGPVSGMPLGYVLKYDTPGKRILVLRMTYSDWAAGFPGLDDATPGADPDRDGIANLMEYALAGSPGAEDVAILPTQVLNANNLLFRYKRSDVSKYNTTQVVQWGTDLSTWTDIPVTESSSPKVLVESNGDEPDDITVTIPRVPGEMFARLKVTQP